MPKSMTGFGSAEGAVAGGRLQVDLRTVNHRHFNAQLKVPSNLSELEGQLRELLRRDISRGHVVCSARWTEDAPRDSTIAVNVERARQVVDALRELQNELELPGEIDVNFVARQPDVFVSSMGDMPEIQWSEVEAVVEAALVGLIEMRVKEGNSLAEELERLISGMDQSLKEVEKRAPERLVAERDRLSNSVQELLNGVSPNEDRIAQEIAFLADKLDITEEIVRLRAHIDAVRDCLAGADAVGKQLSFLGQEMLREVNTIGSKANDAQITHAVIGMKGELEKFREQIENIE